MPAEPRWATPRTPERRTLGHAAWKVSKLLKQELMPWQRGVIDVATELLPNGRFAYRNVILTIPRQNGKTTALLAMVVARALLEPGTRIAYCAQSALDARKKWREDWVPAIEDSLLAPMVRMSWAPGDEKMVFANGSRVTITASTEKAGHGQTKLDIAIVDEAFAYRDSRLEQALRPAMVTRPNAQLWVVSTAGTPTLSTYLWGKVKSGRKFAEEGRTKGTCYFEWSAPDDAPAHEPATWRACMPALGQTITEEIVADDYQSLANEGKLSEFQRAYLNRWVAAMGDPIVSLDRWAELANPSAPRPPWMVLGVDIGRHDSSAAIVAVGESEDGLQSTVLDSGEGAGWLVGSLSSYAQRYEPAMILVDGKACAHVLPELERAVGFERLRVLKTADIPAACSFWLSLAQSGKLHHRGEPELTAALAGAGQRSLLDGWAWSRAKSGVDITPLVAQTWACSFWMGSWGDG